MATPVTSPTASIERKADIHASFDLVARKYDVMCSLNPGYARHLRMSARRLELKPDARILDLCCGTGLSTLALRQVYPEATIIGIDASEGMLEHARTKPELKGIEFVHGDAMDPAACGVEGPFDGILMAYGLRNVPDPDVSLPRVREMLAPGGRLCCHEYSVADSRYAQGVWNVVMMGIVYPLAKVVTGSTDIFRYLRKSVLAFDGKRTIEERMRRAGFAGVRTLPMDGWQRGVAHSFLGDREPGVEVQG